MYCLNLMRIALELARHNRVYEDIATKFFEHFLHIAEAMNNMGDEGIGLWNEQRRVLLRRAEPAQRPNDAAEGPFHGRPDSPVRRRNTGRELLEQIPGFAGRLKWFLNYRPDLAKLVSRWNEPRHGPAPSCCPCCAATA